MKNFFYHAPVKVLFGEGSVERHLGTELRACGRNLNQLTVLAHEGHIQTVHLRETVEALGRTYDAVNALLTEKGQVISYGNV